MKLLFVYPTLQASPRIWEYFDVDGILVSADVLVDDGAGVKELLGFDGFVLADSGGYRLLSRKRVLDVDEVLTAQLKAKADVNVTLDYPLSLRPNRQEFEVKAKKSIENVGIWLDAFGPDKVMPVLHARTKRQLRLVKEWLVERYGNVFSHIGLGSLAELSRYDPISMIKLASYARKFFNNVKLHAFGCGNSSAVILALIGFDSVDMASHIHDARYGMVRHPQNLSMAVIAERRVSRPTIKLDELFSLCSCPACQSRDVEIAKWGRRGLILRAVHNAWWLKKMLKEKILTPRWRKYWEKAMKNS